MNKYKITFVRNETIVSIATISIDAPNEDKAREIADDLLEKGLCDDSWKSKYSEINEEDIEEIELCSQP